MTPMAQSHLKQVSRAAARLEKARRDLAAAIVAAHESGESLRDIAPYAGIGYSRVHDIVRQAQRETDEN